MSRIKKQSLYVISQTNTRHPIPPLIYLFCSAKNTKHAHAGFPFICFFFSPSGTLSRVGDAQRKKKGTRPSLLFGPWSARRPSAGYAAAAGKKERAKKRRESKKKEGERPIPRRHAGRAAKRATSNFLCIFLPRGRRALCRRARAERWTSPRDQVATVY